MVGGGLAVLAIVVIAVIVGVKNNKHDNDGPATAPSMPTFSPATTPLNDPGAGEPLIPSQDEATAQEPSIPDYDPPTFSITAPPTPTVKDGCAEAERTMDAYYPQINQLNTQKNNPAVANTYFRLGGELSGDAALATDPVVRNAIQALSNISYSYSTAIQANDATTMTNTYNQQTQILAHLRSVCAPG